MLDPLVNYFDDSNIRILMRILDKEGINNEIENKTCLIIKDIFNNNNDNDSIVNKQITPQFIQNILNYLDRDCIVNNNNISQSSTDIGYALVLESLSHNCILLLLYFIVSYHVLINELNGISIILHKLQRTENTQLKLILCKILRNICRNHEDSPILLVDHGDNENQIIIANKGGIRVLITLLNTEELDILLVVLNTIRNITLNSYNQKLFVNENGLSYLIKYLNNPNMELKIITVSILSNLCQRKENHVFIMSYNIIGELLNMLLSNNEILIQNVCCIIRLLSQNYYTEIMLLDPMKYIKPLLNNENDEIKKVAMFTLSFFN